MASYASLRRERNVHAVTINDARYLQEALKNTLFNARTRLLTPIVLAVCFSSMAGWPFAAGWAIATLLIEVLGPRAERMRLWSSHPRFATRLAIGYVSLHHGVLAALGVAAALNGGMWGLVCGECMLLALMMYVTVSAKRSALYYYAAIWPLVLSSLGIAAHGLTMSGSQWDRPATLLLGVGLFILHSHHNAKANRLSAIVVEEARDRAEAATAAKSAFVAMVSHELRTPISGIVAGSAELEAAAPNAAIRNNALLITKSARMMRQLLDDLLDLSKLDAGRMSVEEVTFDARDALADAIGFWRPELRRRSLGFRVQGMRQVPRWLVGDPTRLRQILNNLFSNAVKFTETGVITLRATVSSSDDGRVRVNLDVIDTGPGMSEAQLGRLFTAYDQLSASTARTHGGTGLGLHLSREFARLMGGELTATSVLGEGSAFNLTIDVPIAAAPQIVTDEAVIAIDGLRLLIVDDHEVNRQAFSLMLAPIASRIVCAADGEEALELLGADSYDLVLMDIHMPRLGGIEATRRLRASASPSQGAAVIALSGAGSAEDMRACKAAGMDGFVTKPVEARELFTAIEQALVRQPERMAV
jgi:signal transduction histidine kinase/ActR/RegA family two-component response regulator